LRCFGKKDYADIISFCGCCAVGIELYGVIMSIYAAVTTSEIALLVNGVGNIIHKIIIFFG